MEVTRRTGSGRRRKEDDVATKISRRKFLAASGATAAIAKVARPAVAQQNPVKIGLMTVKTGGLAAGGVHLEEGIACFLKDKNFTLAGRKTDTTSTRTKNSSHWAPLTLLRPALGGW
jgi:hypothetical protein